MENNNKTYNPLRRKYSIVLLCDLCYSFEVLPDLCCVIWQAYGKLFLSSVLTVSTCLMVIFLIESYLATAPLTYIPNQDHATAMGSLDQYLHKLPIEDRLLYAVNKLPFKVMTPSMLLLEDLYFSPSTHKLVHYDNLVLQQPQVSCGGSEFLLILVPSHPDSIRERRAIRETWGTAARGRAWPWKGHSFPVKLVFVLGIFGTSSFNDSLENSKFEDSYEYENDGIGINSYSTKNNSSLYQNKNPNSPHILKTNIIHVGEERAYHTVAINKTGQEIKRWENTNFTESHSDMVDGYSSKMVTDDRRELNSMLSRVPEQRPKATEFTKPILNSEVDLIPEISSFDDILQFDMIDSYANLTRKIILSLRWLVKSCTTAKFILKVDPDVFVNIPLLTTFLTHYGEYNSIYGHIYPNSLVERDGKWAVSKAVLPIPKYPIYAAGNAYVISKDAAAKIIELAARFLYVRVEDAFITGILASIGGINRVHVGGFTKWTESRPDPCDFIRDRKYVGNNFTEYDQRVYWREIIDNGSYRCDK